MKPISRGELEADVIIPDAVLHEATKDSARLGAQDIIAWVKANRTSVEIAPMTAYQISDAAPVTMPNLREPDLGERAAIEVIEEPDPSDWLPTTATCRSGRP